MGQYASSTHARTNSAIVNVADVSAVPCGLCKGTCITSCRRVALLVASMKCMTMSLLSGFSIAKSWRTAFSGVVSASFVGSLENASVAWCFVLARSTMLKLNSGKQIHLRTSCQELTNNFNIYLSESWSAPIVTQFLSRYGPQS